MKHDWIIRRVPVLTGHNDDGEPIIGDRIEVIWKRHDKPYPSAGDMLHAITATRERFGRSPDLLVTNVPAGSKIFGIEVA